jgi:hypothetical protein
LSRCQVSCPGCQGCSIAVSLYFRYYRDVASCQLPGCQARWSQAAVPSAAPLHRCCVAAAVPVLPGCVTGLLASCQVADALIAASLLRPVDHCVIAGQVIRVLATPVRPSGQLPCSSGRCVIRPARPVRPSAAVVRPVADVSQAGCAHPRPCQVASLRCQAGCGRFQAMIPLCRSLLPGRCGYQPLRLP